MPPADYGAPCRVESRNSRGSVPHPVRALHWFHVEHFECLSPTHVTAALQTDCTEPYDGDLQMSADNTPLEVSSRSVKMLVARPSLPGAVARLYVSRAKLRCAGDRRWFSGGPGWPDRMSAVRASHGTEQRRCGVDNGATHPRRTCRAWNPHSSQDALRRRLRP